MEISELDKQILGVLWELQKEHEIAKRQGFPARAPSRFPKSHDSMIPENRWRVIASGLSIDYVQFEAILKIIKNEGMLEKFEFKPDFV